MASDERPLMAIEYLQRALDDADVRRNLARGAAALRSASGQLSPNGNRVPKATRRKRLQNQLREAITSFGRVGAAAREAELARQRSRRRRRRLTFALVAAGVGAGASSPVRAKVRSMTGSQDGATQPAPAPAAPPAAGG